MFRKSKGGKKGYPPSFGNGVSAPKGKGKGGWRLYWIEPGRLSEDEDKFGEPNQAIPEESALQTTDLHAEDPGETAVFPEVSESDGEFGRFETYFLQQEKTDVIWETGGAMLGKLLYAEGGLVDSGASASVCSTSWLSRWNAHAVVNRDVDKKNFRFGDGMAVTRIGYCVLKFHLADADDLQSSVYLELTASVVTGVTPLLISPIALKEWKCSIDSANSSLLVRGLSIKGRSSHSGHLFVKMIPAKARENGNVNSSSNSTAGAKPIGLFAAQSSLSENMPVGGNEEDTFAIGTRLVWFNVPNAVVSKNCAR